jgi:hypothetical protein
MSRATASVLAAVSALASVAVGSIHGSMVPAVMACASVAAGAAAWLASASSPLKKAVQVVIYVYRNGL